LPTSLSSYDFSSPPANCLLGAMSDDELVALLRHGSDPAFETLAARYQPRLLRFCASMLGSREDAEDALQDVLISALGALRADDREINLRPWLYRIARNRCIDDLRRARRLSFELLDDQRKERHVRARQDRQADPVGVLLNRRLHDLLRRLEQPRVDHFHPRIAQRASDYLCAAVVAVESGLRNDDA